MTRGLLAFFVAGVAFGVGTFTCFVQADNFEEGARLQKLQVEVEWYERRISGLRSEISRFEFEAQTETLNNARRKESSAGADGRGVQ
ncbi:MAG: hypothetical protein H6830_02530 [Planctomycetes bacterium]|nr:hypothetical protein [Planctomycetota bacterium]MCB9910182.1 hypothetical protein [Planctomycetota bacterium]HRV81855.1 hypothetical protein [Planctomycetota bacterium]